MKGDSLFDTALVRGLSGLRIWSVSFRDMLTGENVSM